jgi:hypothetical protein
MKIKNDRIEENPMSNQDTKPSISNEESWFSSTGTPRVVCSKTLTVFKNLNSNKRR